MASLSNVSVKHWLKDKVSDVALRTEQPKMKVIGKYMKKKEFYV